MFPLSDLKLLILEENNLIDLTVNSLHKNMPNTSYTIVPCIPGDRFGTTLKNIRGTTLVLRSGVVINREVEIPKKVVNYDLCLSKRGVGIDHSRLKHHYPLVDKNITKDLVDMSVFLINPEKLVIPESDRGFLRDKKLLYMSRRMNHKDDILFAEEATAAIDALTYGIDGEDAFIYNYVDCIQKDTINVIETFAYHFEKLLPYLSGVPEKERSRIEYLADKTTTRIAKMRYKLSRV